FLAGAGLALVGVAHRVLLHGQRARHEAPLQAGRKARTATAAQARRLDLGHHLLRRHASAAVLAEDLLQRAVAASRFVVLEPPVAAVEPGVDLRVDVAAVEARLLAWRLELRQVGKDHAHFTPAFSHPANSSRPPSHNY